ncbi:hypothetical protein [Georgenia sp. SYP-B2076]|uniref:hypothetical protein n=1 Tax=Georgenia sp. SYP-B2076 TaxID=2495881 RepID=UPI0013DE8648|nr:hypothetical protein [Georgenia sp. SYP-B2076]
MPIDYDVPPGATPDSFTLGDTTSWRDFPEPREDPATCRGEQGNCNKSAGDSADPPSLGLLPPAWSVVGGVELVAAAWCLAPRCSWSINGEPDVVDAAAAKHTRDAGHASMVHSWPLVDTGLSSTETFHSRVPDWKSNAYQ